MTSSAIAQLSRVFQRLTNIADYRFYRYNHRNDADDRPGAWGQAVHLNYSGDVRQRELNIARKYAFNIVANEEIPLNRTLSDFRLEECKRIQYNISQLPVASVVIIFNNENFRLIMRTVHSVVNRSPPELLKEVILVDDFSDNEGITGDQLEVYARKEWPDGVVRVIHLQQRVCLIVARHRGAEASTGDVIVFIDAHSEASEGWLEPLLQRIAETRSAVVCPIIGVIESVDLSVGKGWEGGSGGFWWMGHFRWEVASKRELRRRKTPTDPILTPTMSGGYVAIDRSYYFETGGYDTGMDIYGGENLEMSFRTWMCGGSVEFIPCSQIAHLSKFYHQYKGKPNKDHLTINFVRLAEALMDDYKRFYYWYRNGENLTFMAGDVSERLAIRHRLGCKSFKWYLDNIYPEKFIFDEHATHWGSARTEVNGEVVCMDMLGRDENSVFNVAVNSCINKRMTQVFSFSLWNELRREISCAYLGEDANDLNAPPKAVPFRWCTRQGTDQPGDEAELWLVDKSTGQIIHQKSDRCLTTLDIPMQGDIVAVRCNASDPHQKWIWENSRSEPSQYFVTIKPPQV